MIQISMFARHFSRSPEVLGPEEIRTYQVYLTNEKRLATSSILIAISAFRFLYKVGLYKTKGISRCYLSDEKTWNRSWNNRGTEHGATGWKTA